MLSLAHVWSLRCLVFELFWPYLGVVQAIYRMMVRRHYDKQVGYITDAATVVRHILVSVGHLKVSLSLVSLLSMQGMQGKARSRARGEPPSLSSCPLPFNV